MTSELKGSDAVVVKIADTGTGIAENIDRIFDTFFTTKSHGMGMGLAICRSIIESHGGTLSASPGTRMEQSIVSFLRRCESSTKSLSDHHTLPLLPFEIKCCVDPLGSPGTNGHNADVVFR